MPETNGISRLIGNFLGGGRIKAKFYMRVSKDRLSRIRKESENMLKDSGYLAQAAYYAEIICITSQFVILGGIILPIYPFGNLRRKNSIY